MTCCCTQGDHLSPQAPDAAPPTAAPSRRVATLVQWALPITTLVLMPKCPMCVAAYVLLFTGLGVSISTATTLRWSLIVLSVVALAYLFIRAARRALATPRLGTTCASPSTHPAPALE